ncbi:hypothetical protein HHL16_16955 [Pseudoflavitalea sp. G-6-1-2]|uniref:hypothetical protein n=1 Tax=Pseudoflavitalea sp. G-6-1-2 TaxID=2728841 RepID=UPI00146A325B|nr:hypothetical protein [Pseudoflavitalea sp. G-6-1-2]NML22574.1 hypothetical protein [Pseudoflavitalea sp. G-6-1-2]
MKKVLGISLLLIIAAFGSANAQNKAKKDTSGGKNVVERVANKTAEIAVKGKATIVDKVYKDKVGPKGQTIYIDRHSKYYWVDKRGHNVYIAKSKLKPKQD